MLSEIQEKFNSMTSLAGPTELLGNCNLFLMHWEIIKEILPDDWINLHEVFLEAKSIDTKKILKKIITLSGHMSWC